MDIKKINPNIFLIISCAILSLISIVLGILLVLNLREIEKLSDEVGKLKSENTAVIVQEERKEVVNVEVCTLDYISEIVNHGGILYISLELPVIEGGVTKSDGHIYARGGYNKKDCVYDFFKDITEKHEGMNLINESFGPIVYVYNGDIVYQYDNAIYKKNLLNSENPEQIVSDNIMNGTLWEKEGGFLMIEGPFTITNENFSYPYIYFRTSVTFGCTEEDVDNCKESFLAYDQLESKGLLGLWEYNLEDGKMKLISES